MDCKGALLKIIKAGGKNPVNDDIFNERIDTCKNCEYSEGEGENLKCTECGCCMMAKALFKFHVLEGFGLKEIDCPKGVWKR